MGIGGLDTEFASIFRRAFASRVFPPGLVEKLGIQHVKGLPTHHIVIYLTLDVSRNSAVRTSWYGENPHGQTNR